MSTSSDDHSEQADERESSRYPLERSRGGFIESPSFGANCECLVPPIDVIQSRRFAGSEERRPAQPRSSRVGS